MLENVYLVSFTFIRSILIEMAVQKLSVYNYLLNLLFIISTEYVIFLSTPRVDLNRIQ